MTSPEPCALSPSPARRWRPRATVVPWPSSVNPGRPRRQALGLLALWVFALSGLLGPGYGFAEESSVESESALPHFEYDQPFLDRPTQGGAFGPPSRSSVSASGSSRPAASGSSAEDSALRGFSRVGNQSSPVDLVRVRKSRRRLELLAGEEVLARYTVSLGSSPIGAKRKQGDGRTPEGRYVLDWRKADSDFHLALHVSYPDGEDRRRAEARGEDPGGAIMIHGLPNGRELIGAAHTLADWTDGCIAVTNPEIEEIWEHVVDGTPIEILP